MIASNIICNGSARILNKLYCDDLAVAGTTSFASVSTTSLSVSGTSTLTGAVTASSTISATGNITSSANLYATGGYLYLNSKAVMDGGKTTANQITINNGQFSSGTYVKGTLKTDTFTATNSTLTNATITNLTASDGKVTGNFTVNGVLESNEWVKNIVRAVGGTMYLGPTFEAMSTTTLSVTAATSTTVSLTLSDSNITGATYGSATWYKDSEIMFSGTVTGNKTNGGSPKIVFSSAKGTVAANMGTTAKTLQIVVNYKDADDYFQVGNNLTYEDVSVMMYRIKYNNTLHPIGIWLKSYGTDKASYIDVYGGTSDTPNARMGLLNNLNLTVNNQSTTGWGVYTGNGYFSGTLVSTNGIIGGWQLSSDRLVNGTLGSNDSMWLLTSDLGSADAKTIGGSSSALATWRLAVGSNFGVDKDGVIYATGANISGAITATSLTISSGATVSGSIPQANITNLTTDLSNKASTSSVTTLTNKINAVYGTCSTAAATQVKSVTCSNFTLFTGALITVKFSTENTYASGAVQLSVNSQTAKSVFVAGAVTSTTNQLLWGQNATITFRYDGTYFVVVGEPRIWHGSCGTAAATAAKVVNAATGCVVCKGTVVKVGMTNENTAAKPTLNVVSTGAKDLYAGNSTTRPLTSNGLGWTAGSTAEFVFDGQYWRIGETSGLARAKTAQTTADNAAKTATNYITTITGGGIKVSYTTNPTSYTQVDGNGTSIYQNSNLVASFGSTATIGPSSGEHVYIDSDSVDIMNGSTVLASFGSNSVVNNILATSGSIGGFSIYDYYLEGRYDYSKEVATDTYEDWVSLVGLSSKNEYMFYAGSIENSVIEPPSTSTSSWTDADWADYYRQIILPEVVKNGFSVTRDGVVTAAGGSVFGNKNAGHVSINDNEFDMSYGTTSLLKFSYGSGTNSSGGTSIAPYYTIGNRLSAYTTGNYSFCCGTSNVASGYSSAAIGTANKAIGTYSIVGGSQSIAQGSNSLAIGFTVTASGLRSIALGDRALATGDYSVSIGRGTVATAASNTVIGQYNRATVLSGPTYTNVGDYAFIIGNGTANTTEGRSNALTVDWSGNLVASGTVKTTGITSTGAISGTSMTASGNITASGDVYFKGSKKFDMEDPFVTMKVAQQTQNNRPLILQFDLTSGYYDIQQVVFTNTKIEYYGRNRSTQAWERIW